MNSSSKLQRIVIVGDELSSRSAESFLEQNTQLSTVDVEFSCWLVSEGVGLPPDVSNGSASKENAQRLRLPEIPVDSNVNQWVKQLCTENKFVDFSRVDAFYFCSVDLFLSLKPVLEVWNAPVAVSLCSKGAQKKSPEALSYLISRTTLFLTESENLKSELIDLGIGEEQIIVVSESDRSQPIVSKLFSIDEKTLSEEAGPKPEEVKQSNEINSTISKERISEGQVVVCQQELQDFFDLIENETELFALDYLGYPWYWACKFTITGNRMERAPRKDSEVLRAQRIEDFKNKIPLLSQQYDYAFILKSKMRTFDEGQIENSLFLEILDYLDERGKSFIIFEQAENDARCDLKFLSSKYAENTISYDLVRDFLVQALSEQVEESAQRYLQQVDELFARHKGLEKFGPRVEQVREIYYELVEVIPWIVVNQFLLEKMQIKALFGGMGSFVQAGLNNSFSIVEVGHSYFARSINVPAPHFPAMEYCKKHFKLEHCYHLALTADGEVYKGDDILNLESNRLDFGMPSLRNYPYSEERLSEFRKRLGIVGKKVVLITTNGWVEYSRLGNIICEIVERFPDACVLLRPHPHYENAEQHCGYQSLVKMVTHENKNDLFAVSDVVLTVPSSIAVEASPFTENIVVFPDLTFDNIFGRSTLEARYPFARVISLVAKEELMNFVKISLSKSRIEKNPKEGLLSSTDALDKVFERIS